MKNTFCTAISILLLGMIFLAHALMQANQKIEHLQEVIINLKTVAGIEPDTYQEE